MPNPIRESTVHSESPSHSIPGMNGGGVVSGNMLGVSANSNMATFAHVGTSGGGVGMGGASGGVSTSRKRPHDAQELISIARKVMKLNKDALDARLMQVFIRQSELNIFELTTLKKRGPALTTFLKNHSLRDPDEIIAAIQGEVPQHREKVVVSRALLSDKSQLGVSAPMGTPVPHVPSLQPEIKLAGAGGIPVAISTTLPPAVARLSQQQGGTPLDPCRTPDKLSSGPSALKATGPGSRLSSGGGGRLDPADQIAEKAKQEAYVLQRVASLQREGLWFEKRLPKVAEPTRTKAHWDYLLEEMTWISTDFAQERKWKKAMARKIARSIQKHFQEKKQLQLRAEKAAETHARKLASYMARGVKQFWNNVGKLVEFKQTTLLEEKRKQALDQHLSFIVGETEKFSSLVAESMNKPALGSGPSSLNQDSVPVSLSDGEFQPDGEWSDDEETIEREEEQVKPTEQEREIEMLQKESELSLDDILDQLPPGYLEQRAKDIEGEGGRSRGDDQGADSDYSAASSDISSDDEQTLDEQEAAEARDASALDPASEVQELEADNALSLEELKAKYGGGGGGSGLDTPPQDEADVEMESEDEEEELSDEDDNLTGSDDQGSSADDLDDNDDLTSARSLDQETDSGLSSLLTDPSAGAGGLSSLLAESTGSAGGPGASAAGTGPSAGREGKDEAEADKKMNDVAALAESIQPKGYTLESTTVATPVPFLLQFPLREYQHVGLDWLVTMYERGLNGILADEMGLGKTIQTISLLAHLACEKGIWGPHLIVVPTSVLLNWEMELKKWAPGFKVLTYYGNIKERKAKRQGWTKPNSFHVCVTSYKLAVQDHQSFRRKAWRYLILDEAQNIKNFKSQRWQLLLNFNTERRLLLTGTPLQNNLNELWSLMHFLMPALFQSHSEFQAWFSHPMKDMIEGNSDYNETIVKRLHKVLRPFLLRRLKAQVEKQLPKKYEHVVMCRLSNRQKYLYDDFMSRTKTKETLANGTMLSVINILMQLRKVCNHPNLFEERATFSPFHMSTLQCAIPSIVFNALNYDVFKDVNLESMNLNLLYNELNLSLSQGFTMRRLRPPDSAILELDKTAAQQPPPPLPRGKPKLRVRCKDPKASVRVVIVNNSATNNNNKVVKTHAINIGNILVRQIICQGGIQGLNAKSSSLSGGAGAGAPGSAPTSTAPSLVTSGVSPAQVQGIPVQLVQRDGSRSTIKFLASAPRVIVQKSATGQVTSLIKLPAVISQASSVTPSPGSAVGSAGSAGVTTSQQSPTVQLFTSTLVPMSTAPTLTSRLSSPGSGGPGQVGFVTGTAAVGPGGTITTPSGAVLRVTGPGGNLVSLASRTTNALTSAIVTVSAAGLSTSSTLSTSGSDAAGGTLRRRKTVDNATGSSENESTSASTASNLFVKPSLEEKRRARREAQLALAARVNAHRLEQPCLLYGSELRTLLRIRPDLPEANDLVVPGYEARVEQLKDVFDNFLVYVPAVTAPTPELRICHPHPSSLHRLRRMEAAMTAELRPKLRLLHPVTSAMCTQFPDPRLIQYDCGKLQSLDVILRKLKAGGHRVLIFTQMTRMLDVLEAFLNFHGHIYLRLDGTTKVDQRQVLMERFNMDARIFCFILSTRSGGVGINLTGADTVVFYDSDWNPTMDAQAQDRCHRIGQTRDVHIYRLISEKTIEENILRKANQKRLLGDLAIEGGNFTTAFFKSSTIQDLFNTEGRQESDASTRLADVLDPTPPVDKASLGALESALAAAEDATDVAAAKIAKAEAVADLAEFDESIPVTSLGEGQGESKAEQEVGALMEQLSGVERWAVSFYEAKIAANGAGTEAAVAAAEAELAAVKRDWELDRLASLKREEARRAEAKAESRTELLTFAREDATNQVNEKGRGGVVNGRRADQSRKRKLRGKERRVTKRERRLRGRSEARDVEAREGKFNRKARQESESSKGNVEEGNRKVTRRLRTLSGRTVSNGVPESPAGKNTSSAAKISTDDETCLAEPGAKRGRFRDRPARGMRPEESAGPGDKRAVRKYQMRKRKRTKSDSDEESCSSDSDSDGEVSDSELIASDSEVDVEEDVKESRRPRRDLSGNGGKELGVKGALRGTDGVKGLTDAVRERTSRVSVSERNGEVDGAESESSAGARSSMRATRRRTGVHPNVNETGVLSTKNSPAKLDPSNSTPGKLASNSNSKPGSNSTWPSAKLASPNSKLGSNIPPTSGPNANSKPGSNSTLPNAKLTSTPNSKLGPNAGPKPGVLPKPGPGSHCEEIECVNLSDSDAESDSLTLNQRLRLVR
ncbi:hypothetical protein M8J77_018452 [Diaphorina citri]|nr:hypothetical protein M8J77_018452 [Diaphorina citri]